MRLYSYIVSRDYGFAPNPFHGWCTLATCKPQIRRTAQVGDWIVGTGSVSKDREGTLVFAMQIEETLTFDEYWSDSRFRRKRPNLAGSLMQRYGDNIYHRRADGGWLQENSHHSLPSGEANPLNVETDTRVDRVLLSRTFTYWGGNGPAVPGRFRGWDGIDVCHDRQGHLVARFPDELQDAFVQWIVEGHPRGYHGDPCEWRQRTR